MRVSFCTNTGETQQRQRLPGGIRDCLEFLQDILVTINSLNPAFKHQSSVPTAKLLFLSPKNASLL